MATRAGEQQMRYIIYGAGGIGGTIAARLHLAGATVLAIARGAHHEALARDGLRYVHPDGSEQLQIPCVSHPSQVDWNGDEVVLLTVKSQHSATAMADLRAAAGSAVPLICTQNGVANERHALRLFEHVYGQVVILPAVHLRPGEVVTFARAPGGILDAGRYPFGTDARIEAVCADLERAGFSARPDARVMRQKYAKLLMNLGNALQAATEMAEGSKAIARQLHEEALACYSAAGIEFADRDEVRAQRAERGPAWADVPGVPRGGGSSWQSVVRGTGDIETDWLNGEITLLGRLHGVPTPANAVMQAVALELVTRRATPGSFTPDDIAARIERAAQPEAS